MASENRRQPQKSPVFGWRDLPFFQEDGPPQEASEAVKEEAWDTAGRILQERLGKLPAFEQLRKRRLAQLCGRWEGAVKIPRHGESFSLSGHTIHSPTDGDYVWKTTVGFAFTPSGEALEGETTLRDTLVSVDGHPVEIVMKGMCIIEAEVFDGVRFQMTFHNHTYKQTAHLYLTLSLDGKQVSGSMSSRGVFSDKPIGGWLELTKTAG